MGPQLWVSKHSLETACVRLSSMALLTELQPACEPSFDTSCPDKRPCKERKYDDQIASCIASKMASPAAEWCRASTKRSRAPKVNPWSWLRNFFCNRPLSFLHWPDLSHVSLVGQTCPAQHSGVPNQAHLKCITHATAETKAQKTCWAVGHLDGLAPGSELA